MTSTIYQALRAEVEPYVPTRAALEKAFVDSGAENTLEDPYTPASGKFVAIAAIKILKKMSVLSSDSLGKSSQSYNSEQLNKRIKALCKENGLDESEYIDDDVSSITDGSDLW